MQKKIYFISMDLNLYDISIHAVRDIVDLRGISFNDFFKTLTFLFLIIKFNMLIYNYEILMQMVPPTNIILK